MALLCQFSTSLLPDLTQGLVLTWVVPVVHPASILECQPMRVDLSEITNKD